MQNIAASVLADIIRRQPPSRERTTFAWGVVAGTALTRATSNELRGGVLIVTAKDARWARLQSLLGGELRDLRVLTATGTSAFDSATNHA